MKVITIMIIRPAKRREIGEEMEKDSRFYSDSMTSASLEHIVAWFWLQVSLSCNRSYCREEIDLLCDVLLLD